MDAITACQQMFFCTWNREDAPNKKFCFNPEFPLGNLMEKKQFLWDFCLAWGANSELLATKRGKKHQKVFFYTNLASKMRPMENLDLND